MKTTDKNSSSARSKNNSAFRKMFLSFVIVPIVPILALLYLTNNLQNQGETLAERNLISSTESTGASIDEWVSQNLFVSTLTSSLDEFKSMDAEKIKPVLKKIVDNSEAIYVSRVDGTDGWAIARSDEEPLRDYTGRIYFEDVMGGKSVGQQVVIGRTFGKPILCFSVPISSNETLVGALNQCGFLEAISKTVTDLKIGDTGFAFLIDGSNKLIASGADGAEEELAEQLKDMSDHPAVKFTGGSLFSYDLEGKKIAYKANVGLDWTLVVQQNYEEAYAAPLAARTNAIAAIVITALICLFLIYLMSRAIAKPIDEARKETTNILESVNDGLLLIDKDYTIGTQQSSSLTKILKKDDLAGKSFMRYLSDALPLDVAEMAKDYIDLLFSPKVKEALVQSRNPLQSVQANLLNEDYQMESRYLNMSFKRIYDEGEITDLLVTAKDITQETMLKAELEKVKEEKNEQVSLLAEILHIPFDKLRLFLSESESSLNEVNVILGEPGSDRETYKRKISNIFKIIHKVKGDASSIKFDLFAGQCHEFEDVLSQLQQQTKEVTGNEFLPLTLSLEELFKYCNIVNMLLDKISLFGEEAINESLDENGNISTYDTSQELADWVDLKSLAERLADKYKKHVEVHFQGFKLALPESQKKIIKTVSTQLIRNSMVHGIEDPRKREQASKIKEGQITLSVKFSDTEGYVLVYKDDGCGVNFESIRQKAIQKDIVSKEAAERLGERDLLNLLFKSGFSSADEVNVDAGRGVGLALIADEVRQAKGKINAVSVSGKGFIIKVRLPDLSESQNIDSDNVVKMAF